MYYDCKFSPSGIQTFTWSHPCSRKAVIEMKSREGRQQTEASTEIKTEEEGPPVGRIIYGEQTKQAHDVICFSFLEK